MQLILIKDVEKLGKIGDVVKVKDGFGRNFLIPRKLGIEASKKNTKFIENEKKKLGFKQKKLKEEAEVLKKKLNTLSCTIAMSTGDDEKLYGEVTQEMISNFYKNEGIDIDKRRIHLEKPVRHLGVYQADVKLHPEVTTNIKVWVVKK